LDVEDEVDELMNEVSADGSGGFIVVVVAIIRRKCFVIRDVSSGLQIFD